MSRSRPIGIARDLPFLHFPPREYRVLSVWRPQSRSVPGQRDAGCGSCPIKSSRVQLHLTVPTAVPDPAGHAAEPPACRSRCPYSPGRTGHVPDTSHLWRPDLHGHLSRLRQRFPDKPEDREAGPTCAVPPRSRHLSARRRHRPRWTSGIPDDDLPGTCVSRTDTTPPAQHFAILGCLIT